MGFARASPVFFGPRTLVRTWGTHRVLFGPLVLVRSQSVEAGVVFRIVQV